MTQAHTHISIRDLTVQYGTVPALKHISVDIPAHQITAIIGPSGCGKTTLLKCMNRLIDLAGGVQVSGEITVDGVKILNPLVDVTEVRQKVGLLSQRPYPLPMSVYENVAFGPRIHGLCAVRDLDQTVERYLRTVGLWDEVKDRLDSPASKLSVGQQQRLCLARGLAVEPEVLLGDEPTSALDPVSAQRIESCFRELKQNYTVVVVTHILRQARRLADYIIFLYMGEIVEHGPVRQIFEHPREDRTRAYISGEFS
ncbi:MAG TPA: phosphate ABC transporter ATP-binding protein [Anaerolineae bacterium]|nr:phosphate ABC transporter ATP-binding protein [Anaerolineae bacterium]